MTTSMFVTSNSISEFLSLEDSFLNTFLSTLMLPLTSEKCSQEPLIYSCKNFLNSCPTISCKIISDWVTGMLRPLFTVLNRVLTLIEPLYSLNVSVQQTENAAESKANTLTKAMNYIYMLPKLLTKAEAHKNQREPSRPNPVPWNNAILDAWDNLDYIRKIQLLKTFIKHFVDSYFKSREKHHY